MRRVLYGKQRENDASGGTGIKSSGGSFFKSLDMDLSIATGFFYRQALRGHGLPFEVKMDTPNETTYTAMVSAEKSEDMCGPFDSVAELMETLNT